MSINYFKRRNYSSNKKTSMKNQLTILCLALILTSCGTSSSNSSSSPSSSSATSSSSNNSSSSSTKSSDACEDMRSYNAGLGYGKNDKTGAEASGNSLSSCDGVLQYYNDNYNRKCFCNGFYKGQSGN